MIIASRLLTTLPLIFCTLRTSNSVIGKHSRYITMSAAPVKSKNFISNTKLSVAVCQVSVSAVKTSNLEHVSDIISRACSAQATDIVVLPEVWNSPYATTSFPVNAEVLPSIGQQGDATDSPSATMLCNQAKAFGVYLIGGSIPEKAEGSGGAESIFNTCLVINPLGEVVGKHRKLHLFDINVPGKVAFKESDSLTAGGEVCVTDTPWGMLGVGICYDIRFPELAMLMRSRGCKMLVYPGAFNMVTGPAHWELLQRARAVDNQVYVVTCSPARINEEDAKSNPKGYIAWGHSSVISPWGEVIATAGTQEEVIYADMDLDNVETMRANIPCWSQKRDDIYQVVDKKKL